MNYRRVALAGVCLAVIATTPALDVSPALAQGRPNPAERRLHPGWSNQRAARSMRHARDYSRDFYVYSRDARRIQPDVAKSESTELGRNLQSAKKELTTVSEEYAGDKEVLAGLAMIEEHLAKATAQHNKLHAECHKDTVDGPVGMECCNAITKELEQAIAEHAALMRKLEIKARSGATNDKSPPKGK